MFIAALMERGKQTECMSPEEWINKAWWNHIVNYNDTSGYNRTALPSRAWLNLKIIVFSEKKNEFHSTIQYM